MSKAKLTPAIEAKLAFMRFRHRLKPGGAARIRMEADSALNACLREIADPAPAQIPESDVKGMHWRAFVSRTAPASHAQVLSTLPS